MNKVDYRVQEKRRDNGWWSVPTTKEYIFPTRWEAERYVTQRLLEGAIAVRIIQTLKKEIFRWGWR